MRVGRGSVGHETQPRTETLRVYGWTTGGTVNEHRDPETVVGGNPEGPLLKGTEKTDQVSFERRYKESEHFSFPPDGVSGSPLF